MKMKKITLLFLMFIVSFNLLAQDKDEKKGSFKKENLFTGGNVTLSFGNSVTVLGLSPYFGYSITKYLDVALSTNFNYTSQRDNVVMGDKIRQTVYGPGAFIRVFPVHFLFAQAQFEQNFIKYKYIPGSNNSYPAEKQSLDAGSFLVGGGYSSGKRDGNTYYYVSILWDVSKNKNSPYMRISVRLSFSDMILQMDNGAQPISLYQ